MAEARPTPFSNEQRRLRAEASGLNATSIREWLAYDPDTGYLTWKRSPATQIKAGQKAGCVDKRGFIMIRIFGGYYQAHRLVWLHVHGEWPELYIDHVNGDRGDNRLSNLRLANASQNAQNRRTARKGSKSGLLGVRVHASGRFGASIQVDGVRHPLGTYDTAGAAHDAYVTAKRRLHPFGTL